MIDGTNPGAIMERMMAGLRVTAVFKPERTGSILDIEYFRPIAAI